MSDGAEVHVRPYRAPLAGAAVESASAQTVSAVAVAVAAAAPAEGPFVAARVSHVFHKSGCAGASRLKPQNRIYFGSRDEAAKDREPAKDCNP